MRTASGLMIAALLTTSMISGTFAKYTTADAAQDSARAAKWGVNLGISGSLYGELTQEQTPTPLSPIRTVPLRLKVLLPEPM